MPIKVTCQNGHKLNAPDNLIGRTVQCPKCKVPVQIQAVVVAEAVEPLEAFSFGTPQSNYPDPFADPFAAVPFAADPFASAPLPGANGVAAMQSYGMPAPAIPTSTVAKKKVTSPKSDNFIWKMRFVIGGVGTVCGLLVGGLVAFLLWPSGSSNGSSNGSPSGSPSGSSNVATKLIESQALRDAGIRRLKEFNKDGQLTPEELNKHIEQFIGSTCEVFPEGMMVTEATEALLLSGKPDPTTQRRQETLLRGFKEIFNSEIGLPSDTSKFSSADLELIVRNLSMQWREHLFHLESATSQQWEAIQKIEDDVFGPLSIFIKLKTPEDQKTSEAITLDANLGRILLATQNFESNFKRLPSVDGLPAINNGGLSWRVAILPFLGHAELYKEFKLEEPWNSDHNKTLIAKMPKEFKTPGVTNVGFTAIHAVQCVDCLFTARQPRRALDATDGLKNIAMFIVGGSETAQEWTNPNGFILDTTAGVEQLGNPTYRMFQTGDRDARTYPPDLNASELRQLAAIADRLPAKGEFDVKYPKFGASTDRFSRLLVKLRSIDPTKR